MVDEVRVVHCRSCGAPIVWLDTNNNRRMPVDAATVRPEDRSYEQGQHVCHFATCPQANEWRRPRG
jgi:hypothetical protein